MEKIKAILGQIKMLAGELKHGHQGAAAKAHGSNILDRVDEIEKQLNLVPTVTPAEPETHKPVEEE